MGGLGASMCDTTDPAKKRTLTRLKRIGGQVDGVQRMVEEDRYCVDVLTQIAAIQAALAKVGHEVLERHMQTCVARAFDSGDPGERERVVQEVMEVLQRSTGLIR
jgi:DNA-binding FrmR family transcriptional regulator